MKPLVSILIPAFNAERWIADTLRSATGQSWSSVEVVVVDDGSTDGTLAIARQFASDRVRVVTQPNAGGAAARNRAWSLCNGDYVQWLDADDLLAPDKIARQVDEAVRCGDPRVLVSGPWARFMYRPNRARFTPSPLWADLPPVEWLLRSMGQNLFMPPATWLVSRELTEVAGPWDETLSFDDDGEYFARVIVRSHGIRFVPDAQTFYRVSGSGMSQIGRSHRKMNSQMRSMEQHIQYLRSLEDSKRVHRACVQYLQSALGTFDQERPDLVERARTLATMLGGGLERPRMSSKYSGVMRVLGRPVAQWLGSTLPRLKWSLLRLWDRALSHLS